MADISIWQDRDAREDFITRSRQIFEEIREELKAQPDAGIVAIEPDSGDYFLGKTLGMANEAAFERYPDQWIYFVRINNPQASIPLPTW